MLRDNGRCRLWRIFSFRKIQRTFGVPTSWGQRDLSTRSDLITFCCRLQVQFPYAPLQKKPKLVHELPKLSAQLSFVAKVRPPSPPAEPVNQRKSSTRLFTKPGKPARFAVELFQRSIREHTTHGRNSNGWKLNGNVKGVAFECRKAVKLVSSFLDQLMALTHRLGGRNETAYGFNSLGDISL